MKDIFIKIKTDYSKTPGPRYVDEGEYSGELFRHDILYPKFLEALKENVKIIIDLDGTAGYGTSFLEESFGGLIRVEKMKYKDIIDNMKIISNDEPYYKEDIYSYLKDAYEESK
jgi:hypothetical protein